MMARRPFGLFKKTGACLGMLWVASCATAHSEPAPVVAGPNVRAELSASQTSDGSLVLVTVTVPPELRGQEVSGTYEGVDLPFFATPDAGEGAYEAVLGVPYNHKPGPTEVKVKVGRGEQAKSIAMPLAVVAGVYKSETLKVAPKMVNPKKSDLKRIFKEKAEVGQVYGHLTAQKFWKGRFVLPIDSTITSPFGTKRVFNGEMQSFHGGLDLRAPTGTPIHAPAPGVVVMARNLYYTGNTVILDHGYGLITLYAHMSELKVKEGDAVQTSQLLGLSGATGRVQGPHLHWMAIVHKTKINPLDLTTVLR